MRPPSFTASVTQTEFVPNQEVQFVLRYESENSQTIATIPFPVFETIKPDRQPLEEQKLIGERKVVSQTWSLTSTKEGVFVLPSVQISVGPSKILSTPRIYLLCTKNPHQEQLQSEEGPLQSDFQRHYRGYILLGVFVCLLTGLYWFNRRMRRPDAALPPWEIALRRLSALHPEQFADSGDYFFQLSLVLRDYLSDRFNIPALSATPEELLPLLKNHQEVQENLIEAVSNYFREAEMVQFAGLPENSARDCQAMIRSIIQSSTPETKEGA